MDVLGFLDDTHLRPKTLPYPGGKFLLIYICNFHVLSNLVLIYICKLHWTRISDQKPFLSRELSYGADQVGALRKLTQLSPKSVTT